MNQAVYLSFHYLGQSNGKFRTPEKIQLKGGYHKEMTAWIARPDNRMARAIITYERAK